VIDYTNFANVNQEALFGGLVDNLWG